MLQAKVIDTKKTTIIAASAALLLAVMAIAFYSSTAKADTVPVEIIKHPFELKSQKLSQ